MVRFVAPEKALGPTFVMGLDAFTAVRDVQSENIPWGISVMDAGSVISVRDVSPEKCPSVLEAKVNPSGRLIVVRAGASLNAEFAEISFMLSGKCMAVNAVQLDTILPALWPISSTPSSNVIDARFSMFWKLALNTVTEPGMVISVRLGNLLNEPVMSITVSGRAI